MHIKLSNPLLFLLLCRSVRSWSLWWRSLCRCSSQSSWSSCDRMCHPSTTPMQRTTTASLWATCRSLCASRACSWPTCLQTPAWCGRSQRTCSRACRTASEPVRASAFGLFDHLKCGSVFIKTANTSELCLQSLADLIITSLHMDQEME